MPLNTMRHRGGLLVPPLPSAGPRLIVRSAVMLMVPALLGAPIVKMTPAHDEFGAATGDDNTNTPGSGVEQVPKDSAAHDGVIVSWLPSTIADSLERLPLLVVDALMMSIAAE